jgi:hypothetical protein
MKHYSSIHNIFSIDPPNPADTFKMMTQMERVSCFHCGQVAYIPVRTEYIDWENVAEMYRTQINKMISDQSEIMAEMELLYGADNPAAVHYRNKWAMLILEINRHFGKPVRGTSAGMGRLDAGE